MENDSTLHERLDRIEAALSHWSSSAWSRIGTAPLNLGSRSAKPSSPSANGAGRVGFMLKRRAAAVGSFSRGWSPTKNSCVSSGTGCCRFILKSGNPDVTATPVKCCYQIATKSTSFAAGSENDSSRKFLLAALSV